jgi:hypothetical protein
MTEPSADASTELSRRHIDRVYAKARIRAHISREERLKQARLVMNDSGGFTALEAGVGCRSELLIPAPH